MAINKILGHVPKNQHEETSTIPSIDSGGLQQIVDRLKLSMKPKQLVKAEEKFYAMMRATNENGLSIKASNIRYILTLKIECMESSIHVEF